MKRILFLAVMAFAIFVMVGCKPYEVPEYEEAKTNETAFVVPVEGDLNSQDKLDSAEALEKYQVAIKRIRITKRWNQTGRLWFDGDWIPTIKVIKLDRSPVTREWDSSGDNAVWIESNDSVGFSTGFSISARIDEENSALYLYKYKGDDLSNVIDVEVRARVQAVAAEFAAAYKMDELRTKKQEYIDAIRKDVIPYFEESGITITTIGMFGGFRYENEDIQAAIDKVFIAQQEKEVAKALLDAQKDKNARMKQEGEGIASKLRETASGEKDAAITAAEGEAAAIRLVLEALKEAQQNPLFLEIRKLEVASTGIGKWNGQYPNVMMGPNAPNMLFEMPLPDKK